MRKKWLIILLSVIIIPFFGCEPSSYKTEVSRGSLGIIADANVVPASLYSNIKTQVKTDKSFFIIDSCPTITLGVEAVKVGYDDGSYYVTWEGTDKLYRLR